MTGDDEGLRAHLEAGGVIAHPTETVFGFAATMSLRGVRALQALKGREPDRPFLLLLPEGEAGRPWRERLDWSPGARRLAEHFWPGRVTLVLPAVEGCALEGIMNQEGGIAVRESPHPVVRRILSVVGAPVLSTSANRAGGTPVASGGEVAVHFADALHEGTLRILEGSPGEGRIPSTLVACVGNGFRILREGVVTGEEIGSIWEGRSQTS
jgi:L-threonylcarbamoyladenylate synthase